MQKKSRKNRKKRTLSMNPQERVLMAQIMLGLSLVGIKTFSEACRRLNVNQANARRAVLGHSSGEAAKKVKDDIFKLANINAVKPRKTKQSSSEIVSPLPATDAQ